MTMQLILNTDSAVEIKTKMSMNEENLEKCLTAVLPVANGDLPNGDILKENVKNGYKIDPVNEIGQKNTECEINLDRDSSNYIDTETTTASVANEEHSNPNKSSNEQCDLLSEKDQKIESSFNETDLNDSKLSKPDFKQSNENSDDASLDITDQQKETNDNEAEKASVDDINASNSNGRGESISAEEEQLLLSNLDSENDNGTLDVQGSENNSSVENHQSDPKNNDIQLESNKTNETDASERQDEDIEKSLDNNAVLNDNDITSNSITHASNCEATAEDFTDTPVIVKEPEEKNLNIMDSSLDASGSNLVEKEENINEVIEMEKNKNNTSAIKDTVLLSNTDGIDIPIDDKLNETEMETDVNNITDDIDTNSTLKVDELLEKENDKEVDELNMCEKLINKNLDTSENKSVIEESQIDIAETEKSDGSFTDFISLNDEKIQIIDESPAVKKESEDVNMNIDKPASEKKEEAMDITPDNSDDVIFNLDEDDKHQSSKSDVKETETIEKVGDDKPVISCDGDIEVANILNKAASHGPNCNDDVIDLDDAALTSTDSRTSSYVIKEPTQITVESQSKSPILKLSNTLDILSDEEDESKDTNKTSKSINIEDDDDVVMLIDEPENKTSPTEESKDEPQVVESKQDSKPENVAVTVDIEKNESVPEPVLDAIPDKEAALVTDKEEKEITPAPKISEKIQEDKTETTVQKPLLHENFLKTCKKSLADMTREEIEEFCILKIVESILDRSNLSEIRNKLKTMSQSVEEYKKKALMLTKQNRDLQVVLKSIQEDQKKGTESIVPLKITRSVGMQVLMSDKPVQRRRAPNTPVNVQPNNKPVRNPVPQSPRPQRPAAPQIPVPRLVPANNPAKSPSTPPVAAKTPSPVPNGVRNPSPVQKGEKRTHNRMQSVTVDLTDDEPPPKVASRAPAPVPPVRLVPSQNLLAPPRPASNSPRKVYIPISGPQGQNVRPGQTIMLKTVAASSGPRPRCPPPHMVRMPTGMRMNRPQGMRHPAPLPDCMKQYQPPNWKALPPAPDLKLAKVENGIVISWKIEGYQEDSYEEIASYQLYAYQETSSPPNTALWKKIGDVKALPLPMACTLTQFMAGYKYYFAVRAVDIRSRLGPFSLPGSILLLNKM